ncbi:NAD(P)H-dependent oxidoreductase [Aliagarivorans marinus]|uniref:NAD(P)H-dependent oxidoreductase n=1 Tax=Aliagarivorans marinus TaxID=561965 RepID=UPI000406B191|nr:NAD(P)H-dependent oxidoreductase [Aliagarivorans marinus]
MSQVLVISGHPDLDGSYTNSVIIDELAQRISNIEVRRLDRLYPDYQIDVAAEQQAMLDADVIVLQFPFYWYSVPALMKKWVDDVFSFNFAYGPEGDKLKGKDFILSFTVGGPAESYQPLGYNHFTIEQMLRPLEQTAYLAGMNYRSPVYTHRMVYIPNVYNELDEVQGRAKDHAARLSAQIEQYLTAPESRIQRFVSQWFARFDILPEDSSAFTERLASDSVMSMPEGEFVGLEGFRDWYTQARATFKPDCQHIIEQVEVKPEGDKFKVELRIRLIADTYSDSALKGESLNLLVNEEWQLSLDEQGEVTIHTYKVDPVVS